MSTTANTAARLDFVVVVPARHDSSRLPGKVLLDIGGRPMLEWVCERAAASGAREVIVATDDRRVAAAVRGFAVRVAMTRHDHPSGTDRIAEVAVREHFDDEQVVVNLQGDEPLMPAAAVSQVAAALAARPGHAIATLCTRIEDGDELFDPAVVKVVRDTAGDALYFSRAPIPWERDTFAAQGRALPRAAPCYRHIGLYAYRAAYLRRYAAMAPCALERAESLEQLRALHAGERIHVAEARRAPPPGVDTLDDLQRVRASLAARSGASDRRQGRP